MPVQMIAEGSGVIAVAAGYDLTCALVGGGVRCWDDTPGSTPSQMIASGSGVTSIAIGGGDICTVLNGGVNGSVRCWGRDGIGQVFPVGSGVTEIAAGSNHTCAVVNGGAQCWGDNSNGQIGPSTPVGLLTPISVITTGSGVTKIAAGNGHTCAVANGGVICFGDGSRGQLGGDAAILQKSNVRLLAPAAAAQPENRYRIFIPSTGGHLFTTDKNEYDVLSANSGPYIAEGIDHKIYRSSVTINNQMATPYYRLFIKPARQHFWTSDINEYNVLRVQKQLFIDEGIDGYLFLNAGVTGSVPLYRLVLTNTAIHHWTIDKNEFDFLVRSGDWLPEGNAGNPAGVAGYVIPK